MEFSRQECWSGLPFPSPKRCSMALIIQISSVQSLSRVWLFPSPWIAAGHASLSITNSGSSPNSCPSSQWCLPAISSSVVPFSSCPQSLQASGSFPISQFFISDGQSTGVSALASVLPKNTQDWCPLEWTGWTSLQSKGLSRVFSNTTVQKHQFFGTQLSSQSNSHPYMTTGKTIPLTRRCFQYLNCVIKFSQFNGPRKFSYISPETRGSKNTQEQRRKD